jgi:hypothetical protein
MWHQWPVAHAVDPAINHYVLSAETPSDPQTHIDVGFKVSQ